MAQNATPGEFPGVALIVTIPCCNGRLADSELLARALPTLCAILEVAHVRETYHPLQTPLSRGSRLATIFYCSSQRYLPILQAVLHCSGTARLLSIVRLLLAAYLTVCFVPPESQAAKLFTCSSDTSQYSQEAEPKLTADSPHRFWSVAFHELDSDGRPSGGCRGKRLSAIRSKNELDVDFSSLPTVDGPVEASSESSFQHSLVTQHVRLQI